MIRYALKCSQGHAFESWFQSAEAYDGLVGRRLVSCAVCGGDDISKALMAPGVATGAEGDTAQAGSLAAPSHPAEAMLRAMHAHLQKASTYVGGNFAREARAMHLGDVPEKAIHGEAGPEEARALIEDGVPILPLPVIPRSKAN